MTATGLLPADHPQRIALNDEVHARPSQPLTAPARLSCLALLGDAAERDAAWASVRALADAAGIPSPAGPVSHFVADFHRFHLKWERHTEFVRCTVSAPAGATLDPFAEPALALLPAGWARSLPGQLLVAANVAVLPAPGADLDRALAPHAGNPPVGARIGGGAAIALTDFRIHPDGLSRILVLDRAAVPWQTGALVQLLLDLETYRMLALLALPVAQELAPRIARDEAELAGISAAMVGAVTAEDAALLDRLTRLAAAIATRRAASLYRFAAAAAYDALVEQRIRDLREERLEGLQTLREFIERRLAPAMGTCRSVAGRQDFLSRRVAEATELLATRVGVSQERQNQDVLVTMNRRVHMQIRLQTTVEGLSVAAITYYVVGLVGHVAEGLEAAGAWVQPGIAMAVSIPVVALLVAWSLRRIRRRVARSE